MGVRQAVGGTSPRRAAPGRASGYVLGPAGPGARGRAGRDSAGPDRTVPSPASPSAGRTPIRVALVDDHVMFLEALRLLLDGCPDIEVVGQAPDGQGAIELAQGVEVDVLVLDIELPDVPGSRVLEEINERFPRIHVLVLTAHKDPEHLATSLELGANGFLTKAAAPTELMEAIRVVATGDLYVHPAMATPLVAAVAAKAALDVARARFEGLSEREQAILTGIAQGFGGSEIAEQIGISVKTVATYKQRIRQKLGLAHRSDYVRFALKAGILPGEALED